MSDGEDVAPQAERMPRWQAEQERLHRETSPALLWIYRQWWVYASSAAAGLGFAVVEFDNGGPVGEDMPALVLGLLFTGFAVGAYRNRNR